MSPVMQHRRLLESMKVILVPDTRQKIKFLRLIQLQTVNVQPRRTLLGNAAADLPETSMKSIVLRVILPDSLPLAPLQSPKEIRKGLANASNLQVQKPSIDPRHKVADAPL